MSEYQYYEFQAIDRPLTGKEMAELRACSSRARITSASFSNEYSWGSFKGDEDAWMDRYFDAFLYVANWGSRVFKLRLPARLLGLELAAQYCCGDHAFARLAGGKVVLSFVTEAEDESNWEEGEGQLASMLPLRAELARGDLRLLYLGWLLCVQAGEIEDEEPEPPVPAGLGELSGSLQQFVEFLRMDGDLVHVAAIASPSLAAAGPDPAALRAWIAGLPSAEKDECLARSVLNGDGSAGADLLRRFREARGIRGPGSAPPRRTAGELRRAAEAFGSERQRLEAERREQEQLRWAREAARTREKHLDAIAGREAAVWAQVEALVERKNGPGYDSALKLVIDLRDLAARSDGGSFQQRLRMLRADHARKTAWIDRLNRAGLRA